MPSWRKSSLPVLRMVVRSYSRRTPTFGQVLRYINQPAVNQRGKIAVLRNLTATTDDDLREIEREFIANTQGRPTRRDGVFLYHEILSLSAEDARSLDRERLETILNDLAGKYLSLRAPDASAYAKAQFNTDNPHVHCLIAGHRLTGSKLRLSKAQFARVQRQLETYQQEKYPELTQSLVHTKSRTRDELSPERIRKTQAEHQRERRERGENRQTPTRKEEAREIIRACYRDAVSFDTIRERLNDAGFTFYLRGKTPGVIDRSTTRHYRLKTLGVEQEMVTTLAAVERAATRTQILTERMRDQARGEEREREDEQSHRFDDDDELENERW